MSDPVAKPGPSRMWRIVLGVSLALNLLFVGLVAGAALRPDGKGHGPGKRGDRIGGFGAPFMRALPREDRREIFRSLREEGGVMDRAGRQAAVERMITALRETPFDPSVPEAILRSQVERNLNVQGRIQALWLRRIGMMSDADRAAYADRLQDYLQRRR